MAGRRFRVAFSFAGEKRDYVARVASLLANRFGADKILYDQYHEAEFARRNLGIYLPDLYHDEADLIVVVACPKYDEKQWTGLEWTAIHDLLSKRKDSEVMLCRFERAVISGVYSTAGFIELDGKTPEEAATLILERLALNEGRAKDFYTRPPSTPPVFTTKVPNNLPRLQPFFGRDKELAAIREALDPESRTWGALIDGPGGMGKTSLAVRAAYECTPDQFERIVFVSIKDREMEDDGVRRLGNLIVPGLLALLNELARELGQPEIAKSSEDQRIRLLLDALRPTKTLLILDNLETLSKDDRDQLFTFVKRLPQGCKAILTSRRRIGSGSELLILEKLDEDSALETLAELAKHIPLLAKTNEAERVTLYRQTGGNPLLLRWVAGQLGRGSCRTFTDALHFLRECPPDNDPLEFVFGDLAKEFSEDETHVLVALTYFTLPAQVEHIGVVAARDREVVEPALRSLANRSLLVPDQEERAFALVPMVAEFLRRSRTEAVAETGARLENDALALIFENGYGRHECYQVLDTAWPSVAPALTLFITGPNKRLQDVCSALDQFLNFTGRWDEHLLLSERAEAVAEAAADYSAAGWRAKSAAYVRYLRNEASQMLACADRLTNHWRRAEPDLRHDAIAAHLRGLAHVLNGDHSKATAVFRESCELLRQKEAESEDIVIALNDLANAEQNENDSISAEQHYCEALRVARTVGYLAGEALVTGNLAGLALDRSDWQKAETLARAALSLDATVGRKELIAEDSRRLAEALFCQERINEALPHARRSVEVYEQLRSRDVEGALKTLKQCERASQPNTTADGSDVPSHE